MPNIMFNIPRLPKMGSFDRVVNFPDSRMTSLLAGTAALTLAGLFLAPVRAIAAESTENDTHVIVVTGHPDPEGRLPDQTIPQAVSAISADFIVKQAPTLNAFQLVSLLPGANVSSSDPYGLSNYSSLTLRGFGQDQIGVLMEGAPQNDIGYYYAYPSQFADAETCARFRSLKARAISIHPQSPALVACFRYGWMIPRSIGNCSSTYQPDPITCGALLPGSTPARLGQAASGRSSPTRTAAPTIGAGLAMINGSMSMQSC
jgi:hypothetical protein